MGQGHPPGSPLTSRGNSEFYTGRGWHPGMVLTSCPTSSWEGQLDPYARYHLNMSRVGVNACSPHPRPHLFQSQNSSRRTLWEKAVGSRGGRREAEACVQRGELRGFTCEQAVGRLHQGICSHCPSGTPSDTEASSHLCCTQLLEAPAGGEIPPAPRSHQQPGTTF